jgi:predicted RNA-binding protein with PIN domain
MSEHWLIDGYNLLHALGFAPRIDRERALENARHRLLHYLHDVLGEQAPAMTIVFDAARAPRGAPAAFDFHRLHVQFAVGHAEADDLIEQLIRECPTPRSLHIVSDDRRLRKAARKRECEVMGCQDFLEHLPALKSPRSANPPPPDEEEVKGPISKPERDRLREEFSRLLDDREFDEFFDPYGSKGL